MFRALYSFSIIAVVLWIRELTSSLFRPIVEIGGKILMIASPKKIK